MSSYWTDILLTNPKHTTILASAKPRELNEVLIDALVRGLDPMAMIAVPVVLTLVAAVTSWLPARRAARVDPVRALRTE